MGTLGAGGGIACLAIASLGRQGVTG
jgi:hypothetical protein